MRYVLALLVLVGVGLILGSYLSAPGRQNQLPEVAMQAEAADCRLDRSTCAAKLQQGRIELSLDSAARALERMPFSLQINGLQPRDDQSVMLDFVMKGMDMGINRYRLQPVSSGQWRAEIILPVCSIGRVDWTVNVLIDGTEKRWTTEFPLVVEAP